MGDMCVHMYVKERRVHKEVQPWVRASVEDLEAKIRDPAARCKHHMYEQMAGDIEPPICGRFSRLQR